MLIGTLRMHLMIPESRSLKEKRQVISSIKDRLRNHFNISIAEVDAQDHRQLAVLGVAMVSNESVHLRKALSQVVEFVRCHPVAQLLDYQLEV
ncbi:MAG: DUF503 domain-containing protein [Gemmatales bacterium]|nr:DUF503 domain-containing protein [Gemmatales bacterium]MDW7993687.1 DUF503 domain-containing protein [Gemmatales bacterium]